MILKLYNENPNPRDVNRVADVLKRGGIVVIPTDSLYGFACSMEFKKSVEQLAQLKGFTAKKARYSMVFESLSQASEYVRPMDKDVYQLLRSCLPGPYTFIMDANNSVPRTYQNQNKTIGIRVPDNEICRAIIEAVGCPLIATSVKKEDVDMEDEFITDPELIHDEFGDKVDLVVDGGIGGVEQSTVIDFSEGKLELVRPGKGEVPFDED